MNFKLLFLTGSLSICIPTFSQSSSKISVVETTSNKIELEGCIKAKNHVIFSNDGIAIVALKGKKSFDDGKGDQIWLNRLESNTLKMMNSREVYNAPKEGKGFDDLIISNDFVAIRSTDKASLFSKPDINLTTINCDLSSKPKKYLLKEKAHPLNGPFLVADEDSKQIGLVDLWEGEKANPFDPIIIDYKIISADFSPISDGTIKPEFETNYFDSKRHQFTQDEITRGLDEKPKAIVFSKTRLLSEDAYFIYARKIPKMASYPYRDVSFGTVIYDTEKEEKVLEYQYTPTNSDYQIKSYEYEIIGENLIMAGSLRKDGTVLKKGLFGFFVDIVDIETGKAILNFESPFPEDFLSELLTKNGTMIHQNGQNRFGEEFHIDDMWLENGSKSLILKGHYYRTYEGFGNWFLLKIDTEKNEVSNFLVVPTLSKGGNFAFKSLSLQWMKKSEMSTHFNDGNKLVTLYRTNTLFPPFSQEPKDMKDQNGNYITQTIIALTDLETFQTDYTLLTSDKEVQSSDLNISYFHSNVGDNFFWKIEQDKGDCSFLVSKIMPQY